MYENYNPHCWFNAFLSAENIDIGSKVIQFELNIVTDLMPFKGFGGHLRRHIVLRVTLWANINFYGRNVFLGSQNMGIYTNITKYDLTVSYGLVVV